MQDPKLTLEVRVFAGVQDVTNETRVSVHRAGERREPLAQETPREGRLETVVTAGIYDVQAIRESEGRVVAIRWAERLVVMAYPDEGGRHLEVVNLDAGFGALQVRGKNPGPIPDVAIFPAGQRTKEATVRHTGDGYALFVVPAGRYDLRVRTGEQVAWHPDVEVPLDRTRLWIVP
jgi:hypothetical protein